MHGRRWSGGRRTIPGMPRVPGMSGRSPILRIVITLVVIAAGSVGACFKTRGHGSSRSPNPSTPSHSTPSRSTPSRSTQRERPAANVDVTNGLVTHVVGVAERQREDARRW